MRRILVAGILSLAMLCVAPALLAQRGIQFHGTPGSVTDPGWMGGLHGPAASVTDPTFNTNSSSFRGSFHNSGGGFSNNNGRGSFGHDGRGWGSHHIRPVTPVYGGYVGYYGLPYFYDSSEYTVQEQAPAPQPQVIVIRDETGRSDNGDSRYGDHYFDSRERTKNQDPDPPRPKVDEKLENVPMTTLVYRDGHKSEIRNYAIVGGNLIDLTKSPVLKKIPLASLDLEATKRENEDNGVDFHTP